MSPSVSSSSQDQQAQQPPKSVIPSQCRVTEQLTKHWAPFKALRQRYAGTRFEEQRQLHLPQKYKDTVPDSTLCVEMNNLEEQADNAKARELFWKPMAWLGDIRPTSPNDAFDPALWETFVSTTLGLEVPTLAAHPRLHNSPLAKCGCKKFCMDLHGDHTSTCTAHSGATKAAAVSRRGYWQWLQCLDVDTGTLRVSPFQLQWNQRQLVLSHGGLRWKAEVSGREVHEGEQAEVRGKNARRRNILPPRRAAEDAPVTEQHDVPLWARGR